MSKMAAIDVALRHQLYADQKPLTYHMVLGSGGLEYDRDQIKVFLLNVAIRMRLDSPSLRFDWNALDPDRCLTVTLMALVDQIEASIKLDALSS